MPYLIDGHNLIPRVPGMSLADPEDERQLIELLRAFCLRKGKRAEVFFDQAPAGQARTQSYGPVRAVFTRTGDSADAAIQRRLRALKGAAANWTVVSSDREVQGAAQRSRARMLDSADFAVELTASPPTEDSTNDDAQVPPGEVEEWLRLFGEE